MEQIKKSIIPFLFIMVVAFIMLDFGDGEIEYEFVSFENLPDRYIGNFSKIGPDASGMFNYNGHTYAFITSNPNKKVEVIFVGDAEDGIGHEVRYRMIDQQIGADMKVINGLQGDYVLYLIRLERSVSPPFGFRNVS